MGEELTGSRSQAHALLADFAGHVRRIQAEETRAAEALAAAVDGMGEWSRDRKGERSA